MSDELKRRMMDESLPIEERRAAFREHNRAVAENSRTDHFETGAQDHDYRGMHTAPGPDEPGIHEMDVHAPDIYDKPHYYMHSDVGYPESIAAAQRVRGRPDAKVTVYRAVPPGVTEIHPGDWVTPSKQYAQQHAKHSDDPSQDWHILRTTAPAEHVRWDGNDVNEHGYHGPRKTGMVSKPPKKGWPDGYAGR